MVSELERAGRQADVYFTAADLMARTFDEPRWAVPGLVAEGLNLLVGSPKLGKSWLCLGLAVSIASGGRALGRVQVEQGSVLYAALEDTPRRLQNRLGVVLGNDPVPDGLHIMTSLPRMPDAIGWLDGWLDAHQDTRLLVVDVLRKIRPPDTNQNAYAQDYDVMSQLKGLADRHGMAIIAVHHTRKQTDEGDVFNEVSGSTGLTGAADAILIAKRARNTSEAVLHVTGRDVTEQEYGLTWHPDSCSWSLSDHPVEITSMGDSRRRILTDVTTFPGSSPTEIADRTGIKLNTVQVNVRRMVEAMQLDSDGQGRYLPPLSVSSASACKRTGLTDTDTTDSVFEGLAS